jgi:colanic acid/amylovoran biosynthesis glycosyltransferase
VSDVVLLYIVHEYPARTQTFVWREIEEMRSLGRDVRVYALHVSSDAARPSYVWCWRDALTLRNMLVLPEVGLMIGLRMWVLISLFRLPPRGLRAKVRQGMALGHAACVLLLAGSRCLETVHVHAHFLARCLDVASYVRVARRRCTSSSATGHAGDVSNPESVVRLSALVKSLDKVVCASEAVASELKTISGRSDVGVVRCGVAPASSSDWSRLARARVEIVTVARLVEKKGIDDCIAAAKMLCADRIDFRWTFVGDGGLAKSLRASAVELEDAGFLRWLGARGNSEVLSILEKECDLFVLPCKKAAGGDIDGIPVALMEAMNVAVPVVTTGVGGISELVIDGVTGYLVEPGDPLGLARGIQSTIAERDSAILVGREGRSHVNRYFSVRAEALALERLLFGAR